MTSSVSGPNDAMTLLYLPGRLKDLFGDGRPGAAEFLGEEASRTPEVFRMRKVLRVEFPHQLPHARLQSRRIDR